MDTTLTAGDRSSVIVAAQGDTASIEDFAIAIFIPDRAIGHREAMRRLWMVLAGHDAPGVMREAFSNVIIFRPAIDSLLYYEPVLGEGVLNSVSGCWIDIWEQQCGLIAVKHEEPPPKKFGEHCPCCFNFDCWRLHNPSGTINVDACNYCGAWYCSGIFRGSPSWSRGQL